MKRIFLWCLSLMPVIVSGQGLLPEPMPEAPSNSGFYYKNQGQFTDHQGSIRNDVLYYTERTYPSIALMQGQVSFWDILPGGHKHDRTGYPEKD